jgi:prevent-host-death family protein
VGSQARRQRDVSARPCDFLDGREGSWRECDGFGHEVRHIFFYMDKIIPISDLQTRAKKYVEQVKETDQPVVITQRGRAAAVLVSYESYEGLLETRDEMSYPDWEHRLRRAQKESKQGKGVSLDSFLKRRARR